MALRGLQTHEMTDPSFFINETAEQGQVLVMSTTGTGQSLDDPNAVVKIPTTVSGARAVGVLINEVVNIDLTRQHLNQYQREVQLGSKIGLLRRGTIVTDMIATGDSASPVAGDIAYWTEENSLGKFTDVDPTVSKDTSVDSHTYRVGQFLSEKDSDGYAKIAINI